MLVVRLLGVAERLLPADDERRREDDDREDDAVELWPSLTRPRHAPVGSWRVSTYALNRWRSAFAARLGKRSPDAIFSTIPCGRQS